MIVLAPFRSVFLVLVVTALATVGGPAVAQSAGEMRAIVQRLNQLEGQLRDVERSVYRGETPPSGGAQRPAAPPPPSTRDVDIGGPVSQRLTALDDRINGLESEMSKLTGQVEIAQIELRQIRTRLDKLVADIDFRLTELEKRSGGAPQSAATPPGPAPTTTAAAPANPATAPPPAANAPRPNSPEAIDAARRASTGTLQVPSGAARPAAPPPRSVLPAGTPEQQYEFARATLVRLDYPGAQVAFSEFLQKHREHDLAANAHYWLGESYYGQRNFGEAATAFVEGYKRFPKAQKAPDSLLKLGMSLASLGNNAEACASWGQLLSGYPQAEAATRRRAEQERSRLACR
ncbi:MAG: tol-pal system protein YbgF [Alphaproteobacteria bacterium]|nr:tol-pal system protein YbgF [Alphaproteobacteria bacterium]